MRDFYCRHWTVLEDGGSDRWRYVRRDGLTFVFITVDDLEDTDIDEPFCASVRIVDLATASPQSMAEAVESCGWSEMGDDPMALACCMLDYGNAAPMGDWMGRFATVRKLARLEAQELYADAEGRERALDSRVVNAIGQTAREYAGGTEGLWKAVARLPENHMVRRMYRKAGRTLGGAVVPSDV